MKDKRYPLTDLGIVNALWDQRQSKLSKINNVTSVVVIVGLLGIGILSKEIFMVMAAGKVINIATDIIFG